MAQGDDAIEIDWNGRDLPTELAHLPPGRYRIEPAPGWALTPEEEAGVEDAAAELARGEGIAADVVAERLRQRYADEGNH